LEVLGGDEPGCVLAAAARAARRLDAADADPLALAERVERETDVAADGAPALVLDRSRRVGEVARQELAERPLADEADAGRVLLLRVRQADPGGDPPHLGLVQLADRKERARELRLVEPVQEVALVLRPVEALQQLESGCGGADPGVVPGGDALGAEPK